MSRDPSLTLSLAPGTLAVCQLPVSAAVPDWAWRGPVACVSRTPTELSIVCDASGVPPEVRHESGWRAFRVEGVFDFGAVGVLASVAAPLAAAGVSLFAFSTYDTDYVLVRGVQVEAALAALRAAGHRVQSLP